MHVIFDMMINHSGENFAYDVPATVSSIRPPYREKDFRNDSDEPQFPDPDADPDARIAAEQYRFGGWLDRDNRPLPPGAPLGADDGVAQSLRQPRLLQPAGQRRLR